MFTPMYHRKHFPYQFTRSVIVDEAHRFPQYVYNNIAKNKLEFQVPCTREISKQLIECGYEVEGGRANK